MTVKDVAVAGFGLEFTLTAGPPDAAPDATIDENFTGLTAEVSTKVKGEGSGFVLSPLSGVWAVGSAPCPILVNSAPPPANHTFINGTFVTMLATALKVKAEAKLPMRTGDPGTCSGLWAINAGGTLPCVCTVEIVDPGQTKVRAA